MHREYNLAPPLTVKIRVDRLPEQGVKGSIAADEKQRGEIAELLELAALNELQLNYLILPLPGARALLSGRMRATGAQRCVVSLDPIGFALDQCLEMHLWPLAEIEEMEREEGASQLAEALDGPEPIIDGSFDVGALLYETFAVSLDPFPRADGASLHPAAGPREIPHDHPFAGLSRLKRS